MEYSKTQNLKPIQVFYKKPIPISEKLSIGSFNLNDNLAIALKKENKDFIILNSRLEAYFSELFLHEINELRICEIIDKLEKNLKRKAVENISHFINSISLNQYKTLDSNIKPFSNYIDSDILPKL